MTRERSLLDRVRRRIGIARTQLAIRKVRAVIAYHRALGFPGRVCDAQAQAWEELYDGALCSSPEQWDTICRRALFRKAGGFLPMLALGAVTLLVYHHMNTVGERR